MTSDKAQQTVAGKFILGGTAGCLASYLVHPIDLIKVRMQLVGETFGRARPSTFQVLRLVIEKEGFKGLFSGVSAAMLRQMTYGTTRLGVYQILEDFFTVDNKKPTLVVKTLIGVIAGGFGALVGNPADLSLVRMASDKRLPPEQRRNYKNVLNALRRIYSEEGLAAWWRGCSPTVVRAVVLNMVQLPGYSQFKQLLIEEANQPDGFLVHFLASFSAGFFASIISIPADIVKTRLQNMKVQSDGTIPYKGILDCLSKICKNEGILALWSGFWPYYWRLAPQTVLMFMILEQLKKHISI